MASVEVTTSSLSQSERSFDSLKVIDCGNCPRITRHDTQPFTGHVSAVSANQSEASSFITAGKLEIIDGFV